MFRAVANQSLASHWRDSLVPNYVGTVRRQAPSREKVRETNMQPLDLAAVLARLEAARAQHPDGIIAFDADGTLWNSRSKSISAPQRPTSRARSTTRTSKGAFPKSAPAK